MTDVVTGAELWRRVLDARLADVHTAMPGKVVSFDASAQTVDVQPQIKNVIAGEESEQEESYPVLRSVPVIYPRCGKYLLAFPLEADDIVTLIFNEWPIDAFRDKGKETHPIDLDRHGLGGAVAFVGGPYPNAEPVGETIDALLVGYDGGALVKVKSNGTIEIGSSSGAKQFVALGTDAYNEINALRGTVDSLSSDINVLKGVFSAWVPVPTDGGAALKTAAATWVASPAPAPAAVNSVSSTKVKAEE